VSTGSPYGYSLFPARSGGFYSQTYCAYGMVGDGIRGQAGIYLSFSVRCVFAPYANPPQTSLPASRRGTAWVVTACTKDIYGRCV